MSNTKNIRKAVSPAPAAVFLAASLLLAGCAIVPTAQAPDYIKNLYHRIPYKTEGNYRAIDIFYATSRQEKDTKDGTVAFGKNMAENITCGELTVKIDPDIKIGRMLPNRLKRKGVIGIQEVKKAPEDVFLLKMKEAVSSSPHKSLLVMVFGFNDDFEATAIKASYFSYLLDVNTPVLLFDWPGDQPISIGGYKKARSYATASGPKLGALLAGIMREVRPEKLWIKSSSMGCQVVCDAFEHMYKEADLADSETEIAHVIMAAPDVGEKEFDEQFKKEIAALSQKLTTYVSSDDTALLISGIINQEQMLGRHKVEKSEQYAETKDMLYIKSLDPDRIALIDVTPINHASYRHGYYLESAEFYNDFYMRLLGEKPQANRCLYLMKVDGGTDYWILKEGD
jgi:esterase/lipase superfamily enzyme